MAKQGCPGEGDDTRTLGWLICPLQRLFSYKSDKSPKWVKRETDIFQYWDGDQEFVSFGVAWPPYLVWQKVLRDGWIINRVESDPTWIKGRVSLRRIGWRYDSHWGGYIFPTAKWSTVDFPMRKGY